MANKGREIERNFLVKKVPASFRQARRSALSQGYVAVDRRSCCEVRVRNIDGQCYLTVKIGSGMMRDETEIPLSRQQFQKLWPLTKGRRVEKSRHFIPYEGRVIELDAYRGRHQGLKVAEVEFPSATAARKFRPPAWFGRDVTRVKQFRDVNLAS
jgi:CYTH domain-containing protein